MVVMLIVMVALGTIAGLTVISVQGGSQQMTAQRFSSIALYAAESGGAATMAWLRLQPFQIGTPTGYFMNPNLLTQTPAVSGNGVQPGVNGNLLSNDQRSWYEVTLRNNPTDAGGPGTDTDGEIIIQVTGHGPNGALKQLEWQVRMLQETVDPQSKKLTLVGWRELL